MDANVRTRKGSWLQTYMGREYWPLDPRADEVNIIDIAHALSNLCRYTGHCNRFYSVAEHSVLVSHIVPPEHALVGLLHDATEAYVNDLARPLKRHLPEYKAIEELNWRAVSEHFFGYVMDIPQAVHDADNAILMTEHAALMRSQIPAVGITGTAPDVKIVGYSPGVAKAMFLERFRHLTTEDEFIS
jgi:hypothetical protein